ncbi:hypothetical protein BJV74DRAFT_863820 [Russula compacta]|nr:hypothetical protein BJV74DRAFT_863820 [Russula compacta]
MSMRRAIFFSLLFLISSSIISSIYHHPFSCNYPQRHTPHIFHSSALSFSCEPNKFEFADGYCHTTCLAFESRECRATPTMPPCAVVSC